jgi:hypothetical protein
VANYQDAWASAAENDDPPAGNTKRGNESGNINARVNASKYVELSRDNTDIRNMSVTLDSVDADADRSEGQVLFFFQVKDEPVYTLMRGQDSGDGRVEGVAARLNPDTQELEIGIMSGNSAFSLDDSVSKTIASDDWWCMRQQSLGSALKARAWKPGNLSAPTADEPGSWDLEVTDGSVLADGWCGWGGRNSGGGTGVIGIARQIAISTDGEEAFFGTPPEPPGEITDLTATDGAEPELDWTPPTPAADDYRIESRELNVDPVEWENMGELFSEDGALVRGPTGKLYAVGREGADTDLCIKVSSDEGENWTKHFLPAAFVSLALYGSVAVGADERVHVVGLNGDDESIYSYSDDDGDNFITPVLISDDPDDCPPFRMTVEAGEAADEVHVIMIGPGDPRVSTRHRSTNAGTAWTRNVNPFEGYHGLFVGTGGVVVIAGSTPTAFALKTIKSTNSGVSFGSEVSVGSVKLLRPELHLVQGRLVIIAEGGTEVSGFPRDMQAWAIPSEDMGTTWETEIQIAPTLPDRAHGHPTSAVTPCGIHLCGIWDYNGLAALPDATRNRGLMAFSLDGSETWEIPEQIATEADDSCSLISHAVASNDYMHVLVVSGGEVSGTERFYYRRPLNA